MDAIARVRRGMSMHIAVRAGDMRDIRLTGPSGSISCIRPKPSVRKYCCTVTARQSRMMEVRLRMMLPTLMPMKTRASVLMMEKNSLTCRKNILTDDRVDEVVQMMLDEDCNAGRQEIRGLEMRY